MNPSLFNLLSIFILHAVTLYVLCPSKYRKLTTIVLWAVSALLSVITGYLLLTAFGLAGAFAALAITIVIYAVFFLLLSTYEQSKTLFLFFMYAQAFVVLVFLVGHLITRFFFQGSFTAMSIIRSILHMALIVLCKKVVNHTFAQASRDIKKGWWPLNLMSFFLLSYQSILIVNWVIQGYGRLEILLFVLLIAIMITVYWVFFHTIACMNHAAMVDRLELQSELLMSQVKDMQVSIENAQRISHDARHHNLQIAEYVRGGKFSELLLYLNQYEEELQFSVPKRLCENLAANNILSAYVRKAQQNGIAVKVDAVLEQEIKIKDTDIVAMLANIMENAIWGCLRSQNPNQFIELFIGKKSGKLVIQSRNTTKLNTRFANGQTKSGCCEGIGISSILYSARNYGGEADFQNKCGVFICRILLKIPSKDTL